MPSHHHGTDTFRAHAEPSDPPANRPECRTMSHNESHFEVSSFEMSQNDSLPGYLAAAEHPFSVAGEPVGDPLAPRNDTPFPRRQGTKRLPPRHSCGRAAALPSFPRRRQSNALTLPTIGVTQESARCRICPRKQNLAPVPPASQPCLRQAGTGLKPAPVTGPSEQPEPGLVEDNTRK